MKDARISHYFDTKYMTVLRIGQILHNFEDQKFANSFNLQQINFRATLVICEIQIWLMSKILKCNSLVVFEWTKSDETDADNQYP